MLSHSLVIEDGDVEVQAETGWAGRSEVVSGDVVRLLVAAAGVLDVDLVVWGEFAHVPVVIATHL